VRNVRLRASIGHAARGPPAIDYALQHRGDLNDDDDNDDNDDNDDDDDERASNAATATSTPTTPHQPAGRLCFEVAMTQAHKRSRLQHKQGVRQ
jgi:hypothetical protein